MRHSDPKLTQVRGVQPVVRDVARQLRRNMTHAEQVLWEALRDRRLAGLKFRRDHSVGCFVLDFYCAAAKLAVEVDGSSHDGRSDEDAARSAILQSHGYEVLRFPNERVQDDLPAVLADIEGAALCRMAGAACAERGD